MIVNTLYELDFRGRCLINLISMRWREEEGGQWVRKQKVIEDYEAYC